MRDSPMVRADKFWHELRRVAPALHYFDGANLVGGSYGIRFCRHGSWIEGKNRAIAKFDRDYDEITVFCDGDDTDRILPWNDAAKHFVRWAYKK